MRINRQMAVTVLGIVALTAVVTARPAAAEVQRNRAAQRSVQAVPRPAAPAVRAPARRVWAGRGYYRPYYRGFYGPFWGPFQGPYAYGYGPWQYPHYGGYAASSSVRLQVDPPETEVFVDGYFAGMVDRFDGFFQRLRLPPGEHEIELYLDGYESIRRTLYLASGETYRIQHEMTSLAPGAAPASRPEPPPSPPPATGSLPPPDPGIAASQTDPFGTLVVRVQPADATILVDGERWTGHETVGELVLDLGAGPHSLEVSHDGHHPYAVEIRIAPGEARVVNVSLPPADPNRREP